MRWFHAALILLAGQVSAQNVDFWSQHEDWLIETFVYDGDRAARYCVMTTRGEESTMAVVAQGQDLTLAIQSDVWNMSLVDGLQLSVDGVLPMGFLDPNTDANTIYLPLSNNPATASVMPIMLSGNEISATTKAGEGVFSLVGFGAAYLELSSCLRSLENRVEDSFADLKMDILADEIGAPLVFKDWKVDVVVFGTDVLCEATVAKPNRSMIIYGAQREGLFVRFMNGDWNFSSTTAAIGIHIDNRIRWDVPDARANQNIIDIAVPEDGGSDHFIDRLQAGNTVYLQDGSKREIDRFSLSGSRKALDAWKDCVRRLRK